MLQKFSEGHSNLSRSEQFESPRFLTPLGDANNAHI